MSAGPEGRRPPGYALAVASAIVRSASNLVPHRDRAAWLEAWEAEVRGRWKGLGEDRRRSVLFQADLVGRALGGASHAVFLRLREWTPEIVVQDARFAVRALRRRPTFSLVSLATLGIGIGAGTAIFSVVNAVILRPLPYQEPDRLMMIWQTLPEPDGERSNVSLPNLADWRLRTRAFEGIAATTTGSGSITITGPGEPRRVPATSTTDDFFDVLGVAPVLGRGFLPGENDPSAPPVAVLSHRMWVRDFGGDPDVIGRTLEIDHEAYTIVGVASAEITHPDPGSELWRPLRPENGIVSSGPIGRDGYVVRAIGRLADGHTVAGAQAEMDAISIALESAYPQTNAGVGAFVVPLHEEVVAGARPVLLLLLGAVGMLLLIACANVANLSLFRAAERRRELSIRTAVGAGKLRVARQLLTESLVLGVVGSLIGIALAAAGLRGLVAVLPADIPRLDEVSIDRTVLAFAAAVTFLVTVLFGVGPAIRATRTRVGDGAGAPGSAGAMAARVAGRRLGAGGAVVVVQLALALVLVVGAGLLVKSLWTLSSVDPGLESRGIVTMRVRTTSPGLRGPARQALFESLRDRVRELPDIATAGLIQHAPFAGGNWVSGIGIEGVGSDEPSPAIDVRVASPGYLDAVGIPLVRGRRFGPEDGAEGAATALVSESMAALVWPGRPALGERVYLGMIEEWATVVGVVGDVRHDGLDASPRPTLYRPYSQWDLSYATLVAQTRADAGDALVRVRQLVRSSDPTLVISNERTMADLIHDSTLAPRSRTLLLASLAIVSIVLAAVGVYGVLSYSVQQRMRELGIRLAVGAGPRSVRGLVVGRAAVLCAIAGVLGLIGAGALSRYLSSMLFEVRPLDPPVLLSALAFLVLVGLGAAYVPARRAGRVDPIGILRHD